MNITKTIITISLISSFNLLFAQKRPFIHATDIKINIKENGKKTNNNWELMPYLHPDIYETKATTTPKRVTFYTNLDSISFDVVKNKIYDFDIILNNKDTCWTRISTFERFYFDPEFIKKNDKKYSIEVPEVQELVHIIMAITKVGLEDYNLVNHYSDYYKKVIEKFQKFDNEPIVEIINDAMSKGAYSNIKMDACYLDFNQDKIVSKKNYKNLSWGNQNSLKNTISLLEDFAKKTNFRAFYQENKALYEEEIKLLDKQTPIKKQWKWLEKRFDSKYNNYWITFSPLVYGFHSTTWFVQDDFKQSVMFIQGPNKNNQQTKKIREANVTRMVFTEIDHNYVNPVSDIFIEEINKSLNNIELWANEDARKYYQNEYAIFNEYMTWSVFMIYLKENFNSKDYKEVQNDQSNFMVNTRGFIKFKEFNAKVIELYENSKTKKIATLYPEILNWCKKNNINI
ncbi:MAG: DUF4932 domain-containing protein [Flavobacterium sp.]